MELLNKIYAATKCYTLLQKWIFATTVATFVPDVVPVYVCYNFVTKKCNSAKS